ncbi:glyoxalase/bleomycin resistance/extradiol dioxygenase family protein [Demequina sp. NBRC 110054]|uniref:VOC family protein n=1 Tax=Demequina sp. NBRC 110054 TaxID=1570343 RepID=UPI000A03125B|nr:VOC family protein [Demequina sp. NBRC 110054]
MEFSEPQVILFVGDCERASRFYTALGFRETFRSSPTEPVKVEMTLGGFVLGLALPGPAAESHGLTPVTEGDRACITLWTDDVEAAFAHAVASGGTSRRARHTFRETLLVAFVTDPDGHPVQLVQRMAEAEGAGERH